MVKIINGRKLAFQKEKKLARAVSAYQKKFGKSPLLVILMVGDNPASDLYLKAKKKSAEGVGFKIRIKKFASEAEFKALAKLIKGFNQDDSVDGLMIQLPLPAGLMGKTTSLTNLIKPEKDVDCQTSKNINLLKKGKPCYLPATVKAVMFMLKDIDLKKKKVVVVGASGMVGKTLAAYLKSQRINVTDTDEFTKDLKSKTNQADVLISATGVPDLIKADMIRQGAVIIDVGSPKGDVDFESVKKKASLITPVPGGVGPLTVVSLLENVLQAAKFLQRQSL